MDSVVRILDILGAFPAHSERFGAISSQTQVSSTTLVACAVSQLSKIRVVPTPVPETGSSTREREIEIYLAIASMNI